MTASETINSPQESRFNHCKLCMYVNAFSFLLFVSIMAYHYYKGISTTDNKTELENNAYKSSVVISLHAKMLHYF